MANTPSFNWETPDDTDLVKDGAASIRTLGNAIDASLTDLKGGTSGQVLSKNSNTDMDFTWVTTNDADAIQNSIVDAKGDLIAASAADTPARLAVGNNGETLVADSSATTGLRWQGNFAAGKNAILNGDFRINQRSFSSTTTSGTYGLDRFKLLAVDGTTTYSVQQFTLGAAPVSGYEARQYARLVTTGQTLSTALSVLSQNIESVRTFAGQTVTVSFWAQAASGTPKIAVELQQSFGTGGSPSGDVNTYAGQVTLSTSWARYSVTATLPSISGKTLGTANDDVLALNLFVSAGSNYNSRTGSLGIQTATFNIWGVQVEAGSVATAFQTATGTLAGELAACQRYYYRSALSGGGTYSLLNASGLGATTSLAVTFWKFPVSMRVSPTSVTINGNIRLVDGANAFTTGTWAISAGDCSNEVGWLNYTHGSAALTQFRPYYVSQNADSTAFVGWSAEL